MTVVKIGQPERKPRRSLLRSRVTPLTAILVIGAIVVLRLWVVETAIVEGQSMEGALLSGDRVLVRKFGSPRRFDIVVLRDPELGGTAIKRVVGLPGETVSMVPQPVQVGSRQVFLGGQLYIDGQAREEPYATAFLPTTVAPRQVPEGAYFVLGDNRDASSDSREYGPVKGEDIEGVGVAVVYPFSRMRFVRRPPEPAVIQAAAPPERKE